MEHFPWWSQEHKKLAAEVKQSVDEVIPRDEEARWKREFPWDIFKRISEKGFNGAMIPREYGGMGLGKSASGVWAATRAICRFIAAIS